MATTQATVAVIKDGSITQAKIDPSVSLGGGQFFGDNGTVGTNPGDIFRANSQSLTVNETIPSTVNASCTGPISVASGVTLIVEGVLTVL